MKEIDLEKKEFDLVNLPSKGSFYVNKNDSLMVCYLSGVEEKVLTKDFLNRTGKSLEIVLNNVILDDFNPLDLVMCDYQVLLMFLYSTSWGDKVNFNIECPDCRNSSEFPIYLSQLELNRSEIESEDGYYIFNLPVRKQYKNFLKDLNIETIEGEEFTKVKFKPLTLRDELIFKKEEKESGLSVFRKKLLSSIYSIGEITNKNLIRNFISSLNLTDFNSIKKFYYKTEVAIQSEIEFSCPICYSDSRHKFNIGHDFLSLPEEHLKNIKEECFLLSFYSKNGVSNKEALNMPVNDRKWYIMRLQEEYEKQKEHEEKEIQKAKSKK